MHVWMELPCAYSPSAPHIKLSKAFDPWVMVQFLVDLLVTQQLVGHMSQVYLIYIFHNYISMKILTFVKIYLVFIFSYFCYASVHMYIKIKVLQPHVRRMLSQMNKVSACW